MPEIRFLHRRPTKFDLTIANKNKPIIRIENTGLLPSREVSIQPAPSSGLIDTVLQLMNYRVRGKPGSNNGLPPNIRTALQYTSIRLVTFWDKCLKIGHFLFVTHLNRFLITVTQQYRIILAPDTVSEIKKVKII